MTSCWKDSLAQLVEHNTFNVGVLGSSPKRITERGFSNETSLFLFNNSLYCFILLFLFIIIHIPVRIKKCD